MNLDWSGDFFQGGGAAAAAAAQTRRRQVKQANVEKRAENYPSLADKRQDEAPATGGSVSENTSEKPWGGGGGGPSEAESISGVARLNQPDSSPTSDASFVLDTSAPRSHNDGNNNNNAEAFQGPR